MKKIITTTGVNYNANLSTKEIAKKVRAYCRKVLDGKISVTSDSLSVNVEIKGFSEEKGLRIEKLIKDFAFSFKHEESDNLREFVNTNFYLTIGRGNNYRVY